MIMAAIQSAWLAAKRVPVGFWAVLGALLVMLALWGWHRSAINSAASEGRAEGRQQQREETLVTIIERTGQANETRETIQRQVRTGGGADLYAQCLRTARTPANCQRFLPSSEAPDR